MLAGRTITSKAGGLRGGGSSSWNLPSRTGQQQQQLVSGLLDVGLAKYTAKALGFSIFLGDPYDRTSASGHVAAHL